MLAAYDDAMTTQRSLRATHRTIVAEQSEIALKKFQSVKDLGVRLDACLGIAPRVIPDGPRTGEAIDPRFLDSPRAATPAPNVPNVPTDDTTIPLILHHGQAVLSRQDVDGDGTLDYAEISGAVADEETTEYLRELG